MQEIQPCLNKIKEQYKGDQQSTFQKPWPSGKKPKSTLEVGSNLCTLPDRALYVIQNGLNPDNTYLLYKEGADSMLTNINVNFLNILDRPANIYVLPLIIGGLRFSMKRPWQTAAAANKSDKTDKSGKRAE